jgi:hypothetical protein
MRLADSVVMVAFDDAERRGPTSPDEVTLNMLLSVCRAANNMGVLAG